MRVVRGPKKALSLLLVVAALASVSIVVLAKDAMAATPTVSSVSPSSGAVAGGTMVTVTDSGFYDRDPSSAGTGGDRGWLRCNERDHCLGYVANLRLTSSIGC
jgi:hypothetical protein